MSSIPSASVPDAHGPSPTWVGLTSQEAAARLSEYGANDPASTRRGALAFELLHLLCILLGYYSSRGQRDFREPRPED